jgi:murein DD-endopeptidase MepM/ murein hydrolase activator NlpD
MRFFALLLATMLSLGATPLTVKQGETLSLLEPTDSPVVTAQLNGRTIRLFSIEQGKEGHMPLPVDAKPGPASVRLLDAEGNLIKTLDFTVLNARYPRQNITVSKKTKGLQPLPGEMEAIGALKTLVTDNRHWQPPFLSPTPDCQNSPFGVLRFHNGTFSGDFHKGVDLRSPQGRPVKATNAGVVKIAKFYRLHGGTVGVDHGHGFSSIYIHLSKINVKPGQTVDKGQTVGQVGATGFATGPHLHWGMYVNGLPVNPNQWVNSVPRC